MRHSHLLAAVAAACSLTLALPTHAQGQTQLDARDEPTVQGALAVEGKQCRDSKQKFEEVVVAKGSVCLTIFALSPGSESDPARNYGILWAQSSVWSAAEWCTAKVVTDILVPPEVGVFASAPGPEVIDGRKKATVTLRTDANGNSEATASVSADMILYPGELTRPPNPDPDPEAEAQDPETRIRLTWTGLQSRKLAFASGAEVSWPAGSGIPSVSYRIRYPVKKTTC